jgi:hypothetical protein
MSKPIEPKFPKRGFNAHFGRDIVAPDGWYLLPAGTDLVDRDRSWTLGGWGQPELFPHSVVVPDRYAWTYARKLPDGQVNDDLPGQGAPEAEPLPQVDPRTQALAEEQRRVAQLRDALRAVYENCRQNRNKGIGAGPLAMARTALTAAGVDLKALLQWEGTPEAQPQFAPIDPRTRARARAALERNTADAELRCKLFNVTQMNALIREFVPILIEHRPLRPVDAVRQAAEMARVAMEKAAAFAAEPAAPPTPEPTTAVDDEHLDPATALKLYRSTVRENGHTHPDAPVLRMTHDGKVTTFGAIEAPAGCYLLPAGEKLRCDDRSYARGEWCDVADLDVTHVEDVYQFTFARKLPPAERFDGSFP